MARQMVRVGTRTSTLARVQTGLAVDALRAAHPDVEFTIVGLSTQGDRDRARPLTTMGQGAFTKELEAALLDNRIDLAVHSLKDLPTALPSGLGLAAVLPREDPRDVLVSPDKQPLAALPPGARIGTGSPRRVAQILAQRPDVQIVPLRGNVDSRVAKVLEHAEVDAAVLAAAGLKRLGRTDVIAEYFDPAVFFPAIGQGFLGLEARAQDAEILPLVLGVEDRAARYAADAERAFLASIGGGCEAPVGAYAVYQEDGTVTMDALVSTLDGTTVLRAHLDGVYAPGEAALLIRDQLYAQGAERIVADAEATHG